MKKFLRIVFFLILISWVSGFLLSLVWHNSVDKIRRAEKKAKIEAVQRIFPGCDIKEEKVKGVEYFVAGSNGYAFEAKGMGFQDEISMVIGVPKNFDKIAGIVVLKTLDTPGLGAEVAKEKFLRQFKSRRPPFTAVKSAVKKNEISAVTGATISSKAVCKIINGKFAQMKRLLKK
ncbi:MAG: FMN-binding protein [Elusimicrobia bacterium]|nr:FMN-binding protein [Elusimicrobiota bacterium]